MNHLCAVVASGLRDGCPVQGVWLRGVDRSGQYVHDGTPGNEGGQGTEEVQGSGEQVKMHVIV